MWIVGITEPAKESYVTERVQKRYGLNTFLPQFAETYIDRKHRVQTRVACLFPRYFFVDTDGCWRFLFDVMGMAGILRHTDYTPVVMPEEGIAELKGKQGADGLIELPKPLARRFKPVTRYSKGQKLRVTHGALVGFNGVCMGDKGKSRVWVLLNYLGRATPVLVARDALLAA
jgi:transcription antitermination factor NusG